MQLSQAKELIWKDAYVHKYMWQHPNTREVIKLLFWEDPLEINRTVIKEVNTSDWETIKTIYVSAYSTKWDLWCYFNRTYLTPAELFLTYEECLQDLQKKIQVWQDEFTKAYWKGFKPNIVLVT